MQVKNGCDTTAWNVGINGCTWSLLHRAIHDNDETAGCFLIKNGCEINRYVLNYLLNRPKEVVVHIEGNVIRNFKQFSAMSHTHFLKEFIYTLRPH